MADMATDQGQQLKRTHDASFGGNKEDSVNVTVVSSKKGKDSSSETWTVQEVVARRASILRIKEARVSI